MYYHGAELQRGIVEIIGDWAVVVAVVISMIAVVISARALFLQRRSTLPGLFNDMYQKIVEVENKIYEEKVRDGIMMTTWYVQLFNAYELFAFYVNRKYFRGDMARHFGKSMTVNSKRAVEIKSVKEYLAKLEQYSDPTFPEMRKYFKRKLNSEMPF